MRFNGIAWHSEIPLTVPLKPDYIIERSNGIEWYFYTPLSVPLKNALTLNDPMVSTE